MHAILLSDDCSEVQIIATFTAFALLLIVIGLITFNLLNDHRLLTGRGHAGHV